MNLQRVPQFWNNTILCFIHLALCDVNMTVYSVTSVLSMPTGISLYCVDKQTNSKGLYVKNELKYTLMSLYTVTYIGHT